MSVVHSGATVKRGLKKLELHVKVSIEIKNKVVASFLRYLSLIFFETVFRNCFLYFSRDVDECQSDNLRWCSHESNMECVNTLGSFHCKCFPGFARHGKDRQCKG